MSRVYFAYYDYFFKKKLLFKVFFVTIYIFMNRLHDKMDIQMNHI